jgi:trimethylamine-N-oxide reductase (cytochrome c)
MAMGGFTLTTRNPDSWEGYYYGSSHVAGPGNNGFIKPNTLQINDIIDYTEMLVLQGCDWDTTMQISGGWPSMVCRYFKRLGIKQVYISPDCNFQNAAHPDKWIPVIPGKDDVLLCAVAHTWLKEDTWDKEYVKTHAVGMDYIEDYIMGRIDDKVEKTPEWAAPLCGVPAWTIKALARQWASKRTSTMHHCGGSAVRGPYTHNYARWEYILMGMQGLGAPGRNITGDYQGAHAPNQGMFAMDAWNLGNGAMGLGPSNKLGGPMMFAYPPPVKQLLPKTRVAEALLNGSCEFYGECGFMLFGMATPPSDQFVKYTYPIPEDEGGTKVHMILQDEACQIGCWCDSNKFIHAVRSDDIECYVIQHPWMEKDCLFADILLPVTTNYEEEDIGSGGSQYSMAFYYNQPVQPIGESRTDIDIDLSIAKKMEEYGGIYEGIYNTLTEGKPLMQWGEEAFETSGCVEDGYTWDELKEKGYLMQPVKEGWDQGDHCLIKFYQDPENNPLQTPSGKLEFYSEAIAEGTPGCIERKGYPICIGAATLEKDGWPLDESLLGEKCKTYPLLMNAQHPRWKLQSQEDDVPWLREIPTCKIKGYDGYMYEPVWINPKEADERGLKTGDIVKVYNDRGIELGAAYVTERIRPGVVHMDHGSNNDMINCDDDDYENRANKWINRAGTLNNISPDYLKSKYLGSFMIVSSYLVEVTKVSGEEMQEWREKYPEAFARDYDPAYGTLFGKYMVEEEK